MAHAFDEGDWELLKRLALGMCRLYKYPADLWDDTVQEAAVKALEMAIMHREYECPFRARLVKNVRIWVLTFVRNWFHRQAKKTRVVYVSEPLAAARTPDVHDILCRKELLERARMQVGPRGETYMRLSARGFTPTEVGKRCGVSRQAVSDSLRSAGRRVLACC